MPEHSPEHSLEKPWSQEPEAIAPDAGNTAEIDSAWAVEQWSEPVFDGADLERELELSISYDEMQQSEVHPTPRFEPEQGFSVADVAQPVVASPVYENPVAFEPVDYSEAAQPVAEPEALMQAELPEWQDTPAPVSGDVVISPADAHGIDALLADIERFPVPPKTETKIASPVEAARKINYPFTPTFSRATPVATNGGASSQKAYATPLAAAVVAAPVTAAVAETAYRPAEAAAEPVVVEAAAALKPVVNAEPDFDLETFELDLSDIDINLDVDPSEFEPAAQETAFVAAEPRCGRRTSRCCFCPRCVSTLHSGGRGRRSRGAGKRLGLRSIDDFRNGREPDGDC